MNSDRLVLGGHSFIEQLGNDPALDGAGQVRLVEACLDHGIRWFDTTYQPERVVLGRALKSLGRRDEATVIAWNFFKDFGPGEDVGGPEAYRPGHIDLMLDQLQTDHIDCLLVHPVRETDENLRQEEAALGWQRQGLLKRLGMWRLGPDELAQRTGPSPYDFMIHPCNAACGPDTAKSLS